MKVAIKKMRAAITKIIACPYCNGTLGHLEYSLECSKCHKEFPIRDGIPNFLNMDIEETADSQFQADRMFESTLTAKIHNFGKKLINSEYAPSDHVRRFLQSNGPEKTIVELGSGNRRLREDIVNVDMFPFPNVDLMANVSKTPFRPASIDAVILDTVLEHVPAPEAVVLEVHRILKRGGRVLCLAPWIFPYHGYPKNYFNISSDGLEYLFRDFSECSIEMHMGPTSALTNLLSEYFAVALSGKHKIVYSFFKGLTLLPIFFLKYLDRLWVHSEKTKRLAAVLCACAKK